MTRNSKDTSRANPSSGANPVDLSRASFGAHTPSADVAQSTEIELKFFIPANILKPLIQGRESFQIEQHYFPKDVTTILKREFSLPLLVEDSHEFKVARIRQTRLPDGAYHHLIEFKGPKADISRREFGISIHQYTYRRLLEQATGGSVLKNRFEIPGIIRHNRRDIISVAQVDVVLKAGSPLEALHQSLATVDIELASPDLAETLLKGDHSFDFLNMCVPLFGESREIGKEISTRKLAKRGLDGDGKNALQELKRAAKRLRS
jgi:CYTH domain-containing protein